MNPLLPDEALEFQAAATKAFAALGGVDAARQAEDDPARRAASTPPSAANALSAAAPNSIASSGSTGFMTPR